MKNKGTSLLIEAYGKIIKEKSGEDHNPERSFSPPTYVPMGSPDKDFKKYPVTKPTKDDPYKQLKADALWLKKHSKDFSGLAKEKITEIAFNLEDLYNKLTRGY